MSAVRVNRTRGYDGNDVNDPKEMLMGNASKLLQTVAALPAFASCDAAIDAARIIPVQHTASIAITIQS
jgi:hypothetical protein